MDDARERFQRAMEVFAEVCDLPPTRRAAVLDERCAADDELRAEVESLLREHDHPVVLHRERMIDFGAVGVEDSERAKPQAALPRCIGHYRILRVIGEGGMGLVYEAEQENPRRSVALKIIRRTLGPLASPQLLKRFRLEAHVLGRLDHPGIARIFEAGVEELTLSSGESAGVVPFFAMELVHGPPLHRFAREHNLSIKQRLELIAEVCDAVHHAHERGVIHRDLKPGNILVKVSGVRPQVSGMTAETTGDPRNQAPDTFHVKPDTCPEVKILDFGVARLTDVDAPITTLQTDSGQVVGTLAYMSPEQVAGDHSAIDRRADVYAIGVILYELLAERPPLDLSGRSIADVARTIREEEPTRLGLHNSRFRGDVETIVSKAIDKDPQRRYPTAAALAEDIRRHLHDEAIGARPPSAAYRFRKFARRNRAAVLGTAGVFLALVLGLIGTTRFAISTAKERREAEAARDEARTEARKLQAVHAFVVAMLAEADPTTNPLGRDMTVAEMLDAAAARLAGFADAPEVEAEVRTTIGNAYRELGRTGDAFVHLDAAVEIRRNHGASRAALAGALENLAASRLDLNEFAEARGLLEEALALRRSEALDDDRRGALAQSMGALAQAHFHVGEYYDAERLAREAIELGRDVVHDRGALAVLHETLGLTLWRMGRLSETIPLMRNAVEMLREVNEDHPRYLRSLNNLAVMLRIAGELDEAEETYRTALEGAKRVYGQEHPFVATSMNNLGWLLVIREDLDRGEPLVREALHMRERLLGPAHVDIAASLQNYAHLLSLRGERDEALELNHRALDMRRDLLGPDHPEVALQFMRMAEDTLSIGALEEAEAHAREAARIRGLVYGEDHPMTALALLDSLVPVLLARSERGEQANREEARRLLLEAAAILEERAGPEDRNTLRARRLLDDLQHAKDR